MTTYPTLAIKSPHSIMRWTSLITLCTGLASTLSAFDPPTGSGIVSVSVTAGAKTATIDVNYISNVVNPPSDLTDSDGNNLPDAWEMQRFGHLGVGPNADPDCDGFTNLQEYRNGTDPQDFFNGVSPVITLVGGDSQSAAPGQFNAQPIIIVVTGSDGTPLANAPVSFTVASGGGLLATSIIDTPTTTHSLRTGVDGTVQMFYQQPTSANVISLVRISGGGASITARSSTIPAIAQYTYVDLGKNPGWGGNYYNGIAIANNGAMIISREPSGTNGWHEFWYKGKPVHPPSMVSSSIWICAEGCNSNGDFITRKIDGLGGSDCRAIWNSETGNTVVYDENAGRSVIDFKYMNWGFTDISNKYFLFSGMAAQYGVSRFGKTLIGEVPKQADVMTDAPWFVNDSGDMITLKFSSISIDPMIFWQLVDGSSGEVVSLGFCATGLNNNKVVIGNKVANGYGYGVYGYGVDMGSAGWWQDGIWHDLDAQWREPFSINNRGDILTLDRQTYFLGNISVFLRRGSDFEVHSLSDFLPKNYKIDYDECSLLVDRRRYSFGGISHGTAFAPTIIDDGTISIYTIYQPVGMNGDPTGPEEHHMGLLVSCSLSVDANRDGTIKLATEDGSDATTTSNPFRFWINDDNDMDGALGTNESNGNDIPGQIQNFSSSINESRGIGADCSTSSEDTGFVDGVRDLNDFFPVYLDLKPLLNALPATTPGVKYKLKQADGALNFVYTNKTRAEAFDYQRQLLTTGFSDLFDKQPGEAITHRITAEGYELSAAFLNLIQNSEGGVILVEGRAATTAPLVLVVEKDGTSIAEVKLEIKISPVEQMFRHVNLTGSATNYNGSTLTLPASPMPTATGEPAGWPDSQTNGKYFVFVHGYNVDGQKARGWNCEVFKRMHVLGSKARFVGVTWHGATGKDYHKAVYQAFQTGDALKTALNFTDSVDVTIAAHSLGNMVVSHAIQSGGLSPSRYYMINAAVPIEAYDLANIDAAQRTAMIEDDWKSRPARFYASNWHELFSTTTADHRNELSWKNRFARVTQQFAVYNFHSPGEDVVANVPETDTAAVGATLLNQGFNFTRGAWKAQELVKGVNWTTSLAAAFMERGQGGWDADLAYLFSSHTSITNEQLKTRPFFDEFKEDDLINADPAIASAKAGEAKVQYDLLARGLPALSYAAAANRIVALDLIIPSRNFDMEADGRTPNQWPSEGHTSTTTQNRWLHSDFKNAALPYVYQMYEAMIAKGSLK